MVKFKRYPLESLIKKLKIKSDFDQFVEKLFIIFFEIKINLKDH